MPGGALSQLGSSRPGLLRTARRGWALALALVGLVAIAVVLLADSFLRAAVLALGALAAGLVVGRASAWRAPQAQGDSGFARLARQLVDPARRDPLTGLGNRHLLDRRLRELTAFDGDEHVLCYVDLDRFRVVNDISGHAAGDELLRRTAAALARTARRDDVVARIGGDEFGVLLTRASIEQGEATAERLREVVGTISFEWSERSIPVSASVGVVPVASGPSDAAHVLNAAESACRAAKEKGGNRVQPLRFEDTTLAERRDERVWVSLIARALDRGRFRLHYQPLRALNGVAPERAHYELLVRMIDDDDRPVPPGMFIPAAERYGLMPDIDRWVIANALRWIGRRNAAAGGRLAETWAINLSGTSLSDERLAGFVQAELTRHHVPPECVCFEITETAAIAHIATALALIAMLKRTGCRFALDDFGSGLSSFAYLRGLPVDYVKIDGTFVRDLPHDRVATGVVEAINQVGHVVGARTVAEFVETEAALERLALIGVDYAQGYAIAAPCDLTELPPPAMVEAVM